MDRPVRIALALGVLATTFVPPSGVVRADEPSPLEQRAEMIVRQILATDGARGTKPGIVVARGADRLAARNPTDPFLPASLQKLATTTSALLRFGPAHRFTTSVRVSAKRLDGSVGRLVLVGGGDPTLATAAFRNRYLTRRDGMRKDERIFPSGSPTIGGIARAIVDAGITRVRGNLLADDWLFDRERTQVGWKSSYLDRSTGGPHVGLISALVINQGFADLGKTRLAKSPALFAARKLRDALAARGVEVDGDVVYRTAPDDAVEVLGVQSPPLAEIVGWINRWSVNGASELLLKGMGAAFAGEGSTDAGRRVVRGALRSIGVDLTGFRLEDGSGLSRADRMTPRMIAQILRWALSSDQDPAVTLRRSLAVACRAGTLLYRMCDTRADGNLRGKTALITDVRGMAGWVRGIDGRRTIYVAIFNRAEDEDALTSTLNLLGRRLARFP
jgi:D-alanyl-D-alanine carboxypeptidase/D-alanyl-D-alanine-endopeptidase (penicillin-binding protein 4)